MREQIELRQDGDRVLRVHHWEGEEIKEIFCERPEYNPNSAAANAAERFWNDNAETIIWSCNAAPGMAAEIERLKAKRDELLEALGDCSSFLDELTHDLVEIERDDPMSRWYRPAMDLLEKTVLIEFRLKREGPERGRSDAIAGEILRLEEQNANAKETGR